MKQHQQQMQQQQQRQQQYWWWKQKKEEEERLRKQSKKQFDQNRKKKFGALDFPPRTKYHADFDDDFSPGYDDSFEEPRSRWGLKIFLTVVVLAALFFLYLVLFGS